jgi:hypothetical protein
MAHVLVVVPFVPNRQKPKVSASALPALIARPSALTAIGMAEATISLDNVRQRFSNFDSLEGWGRRLEWYDPTFGVI